MGSEAKPYTAEDLRALRTLMHGSDMERHRFFATLDAERAKFTALKHHAEAMAKALRLIERRSLDYLRTENRSPYGSTGYGELADQAHDALSSYRKDYPEGT